MALSANQTAELAKPLDRSHVSERSQSGRKLSYIEGWHAIAEANRIFGFDGWQRETIEMREVRPAEYVKGSNGKETWRVGFIAKVRVTVGNIVREGTGYGSGALPELGEAYESAVKEAETDAMKRALMTFGNPFGLALYDKTQASVVDGDAEKNNEAKEAELAALRRKIEDAIDAAKTEPALKSIWKRMEALPEAELPQLVFEALSTRLNKRLEAVRAAQPEDPFGPSNESIAA